MDDNEGNDEIDYDNRPQDISLKLIAKRHFAPDASKWPHEKIVEELHKITHVRLDRERIASLDNLLLFSINVTNVYLQHNLIEKLDGLECLINIRFLTLAHNKIQSVNGLMNLCHLCFLDLSHNKIASFNKGDFPQTLIILTLKDNPCTALPEYRSSLLESLPRLKQLDDVAVDGDEDDIHDDDDDSEGGDEANAGEGVGRLTDADVSLQSAANGILLRSQHYLEQQLVQHRSRLQQLNDIRSATPADLISDSSGSRSFLA